MYQGRGAAQDTTPADIVSAGGTPATLMKSLFQIDAIALKTTLWAPAAPQPEPEPIFGADEQILGRDQSE